MEASMALLAGTEPDGSIDKPNSLYMEAKKQVE